MDLMKDTQQLVQSSGLGMAHIAEQTGLGSRWLYKFMNDDFRDVGVRRLQVLRNYLLDQKKTKV